MIECDMIRSALHNQERHDGLACSVSIAVKFAGFPAGLVLQAHVCDGD